MLTRVRFARLRGVIFSLMTVPRGKVRVMSGGGGVLCFEKSPRFTMMSRGFFEMVGGIVMVTHGGVLTGHGYLHHGGATRRSPVSARVRRSGHRDRSPLETAHLSIGH